MTAITSTAIAGHDATVSSNRAQAIHLLIAEDSQMGCELLADPFKRSPFNIVACAVSQQEIIRSLKSHPCDVALISDNLTDGPLTGFQALRELRHSFPKTRSVMLLKPNHQDLVSSMPFGQAPKGSTVGPNL